MRFFFWHIFDFLDFKICFFTEKLQNTHFVEVFGTPDRLGSPWIALDRPGSPRIAPDRPGSPRIALDRPGSPRIATYRTGLCFVRNSFLGYFRLFEFQKLFFLETNAKTHFFDVP